MFTSCGWFFDNLDWVEPRYNIAHAAYAISLVRKITADHFGQDVIKKLSDATYIDGTVNGEMIFNQYFNEEKKAQLL